MKIEKISDTQVKFILSEEDLADKDLKLEDLTTTSDKTKELFQEILAKALDECGFEIDDAPLMVEALPVSLNSIMIIVTKLSDETDSDLSAKTSSIPPIISKDLHRYKKNSIKIHTLEKSEDSSMSIYSFVSLDNVIDVCARLSDMLLTSSSVYKLNKRYYLVLQSENEPEVKHLCALNEYGQRETANILVKYRLMEHGETIISQDAVEKLSML